MKWSWALRAKVAEHGQQISQHDETIARKDQEILYRQAKIDQLTHEMAVLKRWKFGRSREQLDSAQASLLDGAIDADIAAIEQELQSLTPAPRANVDIRQQPKPTRRCGHEPDSKRHAQWARSLCLFERCAAASAHA